MNALRTVIAISASMGLVMTTAANADNPTRCKVGTGTVDPPQTSHPIYFPIAATAAAQTGAKDTVTAEVLLREFMKRHTAMDYPAAAEMALRLVDAAPNAPESHYNLACVMSRLQRHDEAIAALDRAVDCGWRELLHTTMDPDLAGIRKLASYKQIIEKMRTRIEAERVVPVPLRDEDWRKISNDLAELSPQLMVRYHVPGLTIALVHDGEVAWTAAFGVDDDATQNTSRITPQMRFFLRAPTRYLALIAGNRKQQEGALSLKQLTDEFFATEIGNQGAADRRETGPDHSGNAGTVRTIGFNSSARNARGFGSSVHSNGRDTERLESADLGGHFYHLLCAAVEVASTQTFESYCQSTVFPAIPMVDSSFANAKHAKLRQPAPTGDGSIDSIATGHSRLGTPMVANLSEADSSDAILTTAQDLAHLICASLNPAKSDESHARIESVSANEQAAINQAAMDAIAFMASASAETAHLDGRAFSVRQTHFGLQAQIAETNDGVGCLMRWYPEKRNGIVVLFNSATGMPAAERIAHAALGGE